MRFIVILALLSFLVSTPAQAAITPKAYCTEAEKQQYTPIMQRIENGSALFVAYHCDHAPSYILGTVHSDHPQISQRMSLAFQALNNSNAALFEVVPDEKTQTEITSLIFNLHPDASLEKTVGFVSFERLKHTLKTIAPDITPEILQKYYPWSAAMLLQLPKKNQHGISLDEQLQVEAAKHNIAMIGLETAREQFAVFLSLTPEENLQLFKDTLDNVTSIRALDKKLEDAYLRANLKDIIQLQTRAFEEIRDPTLRQKLIDGILHVRNQALFARAEPELQLGNRFLAIGVLHLFHEDGILSQLEQNGYFIFPASPSQVMHQAKPTTAPLTKKMA